MKTLILATFSLAAWFALGTCSADRDVDPSPEDAAPGAFVDPCPSLVGSWELVSIDDTSPALTGEYELDPEYQEAPTLKILNETHWMFIRQTAKKLIHAQGGRYSLHDGIYTEMVEYSAIPQNIGVDYTFECRLQGDSLWYHTGGLGDSRYREVWRRVR